MNNQNDNQKKQSPNDQEILNQIKTSTEPDTNNLSNQPEDLTLKEFNSTPIDTPAPVSLTDSLNPSESLPEELGDIQLPDENEPNLNNTIDPSLELTKKPEFESNPEPKIEPEIKADYDPEPLVNNELPQPAQENPQDIKQKIEEVLSYNSSDSVVNSTINKPKTFNLIKVLFIFSLIIFLCVVGLLAYFYLNPNSKKTVDINLNNKQMIPTINSKNDNPTGVTCELNGFIYSLNQSFPSADGCNTCSCQSAGVITCTEMACSLTPTTSTSSAATSNLKTYTNKEIGFSFQYPTSLDDFIFTMTPGDVGNAFSGKSSSSNGSDFIGFGGISVDFSLGRGALFGDFSGYSNQNNQIYFFSVGDRITSSNNLIDSKAIKKIYKNKNGVEIVLLTGYTLKGDLFLPLPCGIGEGNVGALVNTNNKTYPGIAFKFPKTLESNLTQILDTLKFN